MNTKPLTTLLTLMLVFLLTTAVFAQGGRGGSPSGRGGSYGSPGMAGATNNTTTGRGTTSFSGGDFSRQGGAIPEGGGQAGGNRPDTSGVGGDRPGGGNRPSGDSSQQPGLPQNDERPSISLGGEGGVSLFGGEGGLASRGNRPRGEGMPWADFGGFGANVSDQESPLGAESPLDSGQWTPPGEIPSAPGPMEDIDAVIAAQQQARGENAQAAQDAAQQAYDQFWTDYYSAVDAAADAYYQTVTASVDYAQQAYYDALNYTVATVDYYVDYAAEYAQYCYFYPWDCYSYTYDEASGTYVNIEYVSDQPVATITVEQVVVNWSAAGAVPASSAEAYEALVVFASDQLGIVVQPLYAGELTVDIQQIMGFLPPEVEAYAALLSSVDPAYWGVFNGGVGAVGTFDCSGGCSGEDIPAELSSASGGVYMLTVSDPMPADSTAALDLITQVYPALNGLAFAEVTNTETGLAYMATAYGIGADASGGGTAVAKVVYVGVIPINDQTVVYALVAVGEAQVQAFFNQFQ